MDIVHVPRAMRIIDTWQENELQRTFLLDGTLPAEPGQFVMAWLPDCEDKPFDIENDDPLTLTVAAVGPFTRQLHRLQVGDRIWLRGPFGHSYALPACSPPEGHVLLVGEKHRIARLAFLARRAVQRSFPVSAIVARANGSELPVVRAYEELAVSFHRYTGDDSTAVPSITEQLSAAVAAIGERQVHVYASGSAALLTEIYEWCAARGIQVQSGWEAYMKCGIGICGSCEVGDGWLTCSDGPVFDFNPLTVSSAAMSR